MLFSTMSTVSASALSSLSWLNPIPHTIAVYAYGRRLRRAAQHSLPGGLLQAYLDRTLTGWIAPDCPSAPTVCLTLRLMHLTALARCDNSAVTTPETLSDEVNALHVLVLAAWAERDTERAEKARLLDERNQVAGHNERLRHLNCRLQRTQFGKRSERSLAHNHEQVSSHIAILAALARQQPRLL
jgi:hypothetical protein